MNDDEVRSVFSDFYDGSFFIRIVKGSPDTTGSRHQLLRLGFATRGRQLVVFPSG